MALKKPLLVRFEDSCNSIILSLMRLAAHLVPAPIRRLHAAFFDRTARIKAGISALKSRSARGIQQAKGAGAKATLIDGKDLLTKKAGHLKAFILASDPKESLAILLAPLKGLERSIAALSPGQMVIAASLCIGVVLAGVGLFYSGERMYSHNRAPASIERPQFKPRPDYYKNERKQFRIENVRIPIYLDNPGDMRSLMTDITIHSSNRAMVQYLKDHEHEIRDHLIQTVEPIQPSFPLTPEGKVVLKEKLQNEINIYLKEQKVDGEIEAVSVLFLIGG